MLSRFMYCYAECRYGECHYGECRYAEWRYAECRGAVGKASEGQTLFIFYILAMQKVFITLTTNQAF